MSQENQLPKFSSENSMECALKLKEQANIEYKQKQYKNAMLHYYNSLLIAKAYAQKKDPISLMLNSEKSTTKINKTEEELNAEKLIENCNNNIVACILANPLSDDAAYCRALNTCEQILKSNESNEKAQFRKAELLKKLKKYGEAVKEFEKCPNNSLAKRHIQECKERIAEKNKADANRIKANFSAIFDDSRK